MWWRMEKHGFVLLFGFVFVIVLEFFGVVFLLFFYFFWSRLLKRVRVQKVMYWQWVKVDCKEQCTQKESSKKDAACFFYYFYFFPLKSLREKKRSFVWEKKKKDICSFWVSRKVSPWPSRWRNCILAGETLYCVVQWLVDCGKSHRLWD